MEGDNKETHFQLQKSVLFRHKCEHLDCRSKLVPFCFPTFPYVITKALGTFCHDFAIHPRILLEPHGHVILPCRPFRTTKLLAMQKLSFAYQLNVSISQLLLT